MGTNIGINDDYIENGGCSFRKNDVKKYGYENVGTSIEIKKYYIDFKNGTRVEYMEQKSAFITNSDTSHDTSSNTMNFFGFDGGLIKGSDKKNYYRLESCTETKVDVSDEKADAVVIDRECNRVSVFYDYHDTLVNDGKNTRKNPLY